MVVGDEHGEEALGTKVLPLGRAQQQDTLASRTGLDAVRPALTGFHVLSRKENIPSESDNTDSTEQIQHSDNSDGLAKFEPLLQNGKLFQQWQVKKEEVKVSSSPVGSSTSEKSTDSDAKDGSGDVVNTAHENREDRHEEEADEQLQQGCLGFGRTFLDQGVEAEYRAFCLKEDILPSHRVMDATATALITILLLCGPI